MKLSFKLYPYFLFAGLFFAACQKKGKESILPTQESPEQKAANQQALLQEIQKSGVEKAGFKQLSANEYCDQLKQSSKSKIDERTIALLDGYKIYQKAEIIYLTSKKALSEARTQSVTGYSAGYNMTSLTCDCSGGMADLDPQMFDDLCTRTPPSGGLLGLAALLPQTSSIMYQGSNATIDGSWFALTGVMTITWSHDSFGAMFNQKLSMSYWHSRTWITPVNSN